MKAVSFAITAVLLATSIVLLSAKPALAQSTSPVFKCQVAEGEKADLKDLDLPSELFDSATSTLTIQKNQCWPNLPDQEKRFGFVAGCFVGNHAVGIATAGKKSQLLRNDGSFIRLNCK